MKVDDNAFFAAHRRRQTAWLHASCTEWKTVLAGALWPRREARDRRLGGSYGPEKLTFYKMLPQWAARDTVFEFPVRRFVASRRARFSKTSERSANRPPVCARPSARSKIVETIYRASGLSGFGGGL